MIVRRHAITAGFAVIVIRSETSERRVEAVAAGRQAKVERVASVVLTALMVVVCIDRFWLGLHLRQGGRR